MAVGGWPLMPEVPGIEHAISSNEAFHLKELPERVIVVGGGYIAVEFAGIFHGLGARVTQLYRGPLFLRGFDDDVRKALADEMRKADIDLRFDASVTSIEKAADGTLHATLADGEPAPRRRDPVRHGARADDGGPRPRGRGGRARREG